MEIGMQGAIMTVGLSCFTLGLMVEWLVHRRNYRQFLKFGADERETGLVRSYYLVYLLMIGAALGEHLVRQVNVGQPWFGIGLTAIMVGQSLRFWAIQSLGTLWTMRCMALPGLRHVKHGPYRWVDNPEYISRIIDGVGLCLLLGATWTLCAYLGAVIYLQPRLVATEQEQMRAIDAEYRRCRSPSL